LPEKLTLKHLDEGELHARELAQRLNNLASRARPAGFKLSQAGDAEEPDIALGLSRGLDSPIAVPQVGSVSSGFGDLGGIDAGARPCPTIPNQSGSHIIPRDDTVCTKPTAAFFARV
jgi:hypothetical protein